MTNNWQPQVLEDEHELGAFDCGVPSLNQWLTGHARRAQAADTARTYVWAEDSGDVVAYYSIAPTQLFRRELSSNLAGGYSVVPGYLLARLALDQSLHGQGLGSDLLVDALTTVVRASETGAGRVVVVDAIDDRAAAFYRRHDFKPVAGTANRLVMKVATARKALGIVSLSITPSPTAQLASLVFEAPDGTSVPVVLSMHEYQAITTRLQELASQSPSVSVDLNTLLIEALGRDPLNDQT
jgi:predicted N-acetyltransferase YhbS